MPVFMRPDAEIHYEVHGSGHPLLLFAPGGLRSQLEYWPHSPSNPGAPPPWMNPMADLAGRFTAIGMDQRNAGHSHGAVTSTHGWHTYASDHEFVKRCRTPLLLQPGTDKPHPAAISDEIAGLAPNVGVQKDWRGPTHLAESIRRVTDFLTRHTPAS